MIRTRSKRGRHQRLAQLEEQALVLLDQSHDHPISALEWLDAYSEWAVQGFFDREPDYPATIAHFKHVLSSIPRERQEPTDDFEREKPYRRRLWLWHIRHEIRELTPISQKLDAMSRRASQGLDGVSEAEFERIKAWYQANADDLPMHYLVAEDGQSEPRKTTIETVLSQGTTSYSALNAILTLREWKKGNFPKENIRGDWRRRRELNAA
jgi:hypothetical protein